MKAQGKSVIALQTGDPDFSTPQPIREAAYTAINKGFTHYGDSRGLIDLRKAVSKKFQVINNIEYDPNKEILITHGAVHAYYCALQAILNPGDEVLVPDPTWMTHSNMIRIVGGVPKSVPSSAENDFLPRLSDWQKSLSKRTVALVINFPSNPTGTMANQSYLSEVYEFALTNNLFIISDEVYENITYDDNKPFSIGSLRDSKRITITINSFSKTFAMTGWRIGYLGAPERIVNQALKASQYTITNVAPFIQKAAFVALTDERIPPICEKMKQTYAKRREMVLRIHSECKMDKIQLIKPKGAFYFFIDVRRIRLDDQTISERLLNEANTALVPGSVYGECGKGYLRMTIAAADEDIKAGFSALLNWVKNNY
jgi:aspartate/methionine/tyrosine aminotransferase